MFRLYNTLTNAKQPFETIDKGKAKIYTCGPTVYNYAHIGNLSAYIYADTLRRYLEYLGYETRHIVNITDVGHLTADDVNQADSGEDKMLKASLREKKTPEQIADFYTERFFEDVEKLNIEKAHYYPRATAHISGMIKIIESLLEKGLAYKKNGNVFFDVEKFPDYGKLSKKKIEDLKHGARLEEHPDKKHPYDFALWLKAPKDHLMKWDSPWGIGYPGWHIECSAMSTEYLGQTLDIHTGGEDHVFPHHENEIAQSEGANNKPFANFWFHNHFLLVDRAKMSKSKGNFYILKDILDKNYSPMAFRLLVLGSHYRSNLNFTWDRMAEASGNLEKISRFVLKLESLKKNSQPNANGENSLAIDTFKEKIEKAMDDDLNTPLALSVLYEFISQFNKFSDNLSKETITEISNFYLKLEKIFGLKIENSTGKELPFEIIKLAEDREKARQNKDFALSDKLRDKLRLKGYSVEDGKDGQIVSKI